MRIIASGEIKGAGFGRMFSYPIILY